MSAIFSAVLRWFRDRKIRTKLMISYVIACFIPILVLGAFCYQQAQDLLIRQSKDNLKASLDQASMSSNNTMQSCNDMASFLIFNDDMQGVIYHTYTGYYDMYDVFTNKLDPLLITASNLHDDVSDITVYTQNPIVKHGTFIIPMDSIQNQSWESSTLRDYQPHWFYNQENGPFLSQQFIDLDYPQSTYKSLLYISIRPDSLFAPFKGIAHRNYGVYILDSDNHVVFSTDKFSERSSYRLTLPDILKLRSSGKPVSIRNQDFIGIQSSILNAGWKVILYEPTSMIYQSTWKIACAVLLIMLLCFLILLCMGFILSRLIAGRINNLAAGMACIRNGNLTTTLDSDAKDEVGDLVRSFRYMLDRIDTLIKEVYQSRIRQKDYEMRALQAQINPHFLYNSLSLINWKAIESDQIEISQMAQLLSTFYRTTLNKGKNRISVHDELENVRSYIQVQLMMHSNSFDVEYQLNPEIDQFIMPNLLLQPLVENAISHGIDGKLQGRGLLQISGSLVGSELIFTVEDNGCGIPAPQLPHLPEQTKGYGLKNVQERIQLIYGQKYGLHLQSKEGVGTVVRVIIPAASSSAAKTDNVDDNKFGLVQKPKMP